jgi:hypothetical protein
MALVLYRIMVMAVALVQEIITHLHGVLAVAVALVLMGKG